ncbi:hypothetical protein D3C81_1940110 [compost metagenome]
MCCYRTAVSRESAEQFCIQLRDPPGRQNSGEALHPFRHNRAGPECSSEHRQRQGDYRYQQAAGGLLGGTADQQQANPCSDDIQQAVSQNQQQQVGGGQLQVNSESSAHQRNHQQELDDADRCEY